MIHNGWKTTIIIEIPRGFRAQSVIALASGATVPRKSASMICFDSPWDIDPLTGSDLLSVARNVELGPRLSRKLRASANRIALRVQHVGVRHREIPRASIAPAVREHTVFHNRLTCRWIGDGRTFNLSTHYLAIVTAGVCQTAAIAIPNIGKSMTGANIIGIRADQFANVAIIRADASAVSVACSLNHISLVVRDFVTLACLHKETVLVVVSTAS